MAKACPRRPGERRTHRQVELRRHHPGGLVDPPAERLPRRPSPKSNCNSSTINATSSVAQTVSVRIGPLMVDTGHPGDRQHPQPRRAQPTGADRLPRRPAAPHGRPSPPTTAAAVRRPRQPQRGESSSDEARHHTFVNAAQNAGTRVQVDTPPTTVGSPVNPERQPGPPPTSGPQHPGPRRYRCRTQSRRRCHPGTPRSG